jgi:hypothetical protein
MNENTSKKSNDLALICKQLEGYVAELERRLACVSNPSPYTYELSAIVKATPSPYMPENMTPGPWTWNHYEDTLVSPFGAILEEDTAYCAGMRFAASEKATNAANAQLIAAAPDLLEALVNLENDDAKRMSRSAWEMCQNAIVKAGGKRK